MNVTIGGVTALDRMELGRELETYGVEFNEDEVGQHGQGDMGIFTLGIPLTFAVVKVLKAWIKYRAPLTEITVTNGERTTKILRSGDKMDPADLEKFLEALGEPAE